MGEPCVPEIGQMLHGNPAGEFACPEYVKALIERLAWRAAMVEDERHDDDKDYCKVPMPTLNTGTRWSNDTFSLRAYYRGDDEDEAKLPNFECGDIEVRWYKHLNRGTTINREVTPDEAIAMFDRCWASLERDMRELIESKGLASRKGD